MKYLELVVDERGDIKGVILNGEKVFVNYLNFIVKKENDGTVDYTVTLKLVVGGIRISDIKA